MLGEELANLAGRGLAELGERLAGKRRGHDRELSHDPFGGHRVHLDEGRLDERVQLVVERSRALVIAGFKRVVELGHRAGREVRDAAEVPAAPEHQHRVAQQLDPRQRDEVAAALREDVRDVLEVARRLLDADDVLVGAPQASHRLGRDIDAAADRDVVDDDRKPRKLAGDARVPVEQPLLLRAGVVRRHDQSAAGPESLCLRRQLERLVEPRAAGTRQKWRAPVDRTEPAHQLFGKVIVGVHQHVRNQSAQRRGPVRPEYPRIERRHADRRGRTDGYAAIEQHPLEDRSDVARHAVDRDPRLLFIPRRNRPGDAKGIWNAGRIDREVRRFVRRSGDDRSGIAHRSALWKK